MRRINSLPVSSLVYFELILILCPLATSVTLKADLNLDPQPAFPYLVSLAFKTLPKATSVLATSWAFSSISNYSALSSQEGLFLCKWCLIPESLLKGL